MTDKAIMMGDYVDLKFLPGLKSARVFVDIPIEHSNVFLKMFDAPDRANPVKVVIARIELPTAEQPSGPQGPPTPPDDSKVRTPKSRSQMAAILCEDAAFQDWIDAEDHGVPPAAYLDETDYTRAILCDVLGITSRKELDSLPHKGEAWDKLRASFDYRDRVK